MQHAAQQPVGGAPVDQGHAARPESREARPESRRAEPNERPSPAPAKLSSPKRESPMDKKPAGSSATRIVLLMTIVGLVGASGYLIYNKVRPGTTAALATPKDVGTKEGEQTADDKTAVEAKVVGKHKAKHNDQHNDQHGDEEQTEPKTADIKTLDEQQEPGDESHMLTEDMSAEPAPKTLDTFDPEPAEQVAQMEPESAETQAMPLEELGAVVAEAPRRQPGRLKNRSQEEAHSASLVPETPEVDQGAETLLDVAPELEPEVVEPVAARPVRVAQNRSARNPNEPTNLQPLDSSSLVESPQEVPMPEVALPESEGFPAATEPEENDPRLGNYAPAEAVPEMQGAGRNGGRPVSGVGAPTPVSAQGRGTQLTPEIEMQEATEQFPTQKLAVPAKGVARSSSAGIDPTSEKYIVQPNDNFWLIAKKQYGSARYFRALMKYNESRANDPYTLKPGIEVLTPTRETLHKLHPELIDMSPVDRKSSTRKGAPETSEAEAESTGMFLGTNGEPMYRVGSDDTLSGISQKHLGRSSRYMEIYEANKEVMGSPDTLKPGLVLRLPQDASQVKVVSGPRPEFR